MRDWEPRDELASLVFSFLFFFCSRRRPEGKERRPCSIQPVLDTQARYFLKIADVAGEQGGVVGETDGGDFQIHRPDADALLLQPGKLLRSFVVEGKDGEFGKAEEAVLKAAIREDLPRPRGLAMDGCQPALRDFLRRDDGGEKVRSGRFRTLAE